jgi:hypothetical protein
MPRARTGTTSDRLNVIKKARVEIRRLLADIASFRSARTNQIRQARASVNRHSVIGDRDRRVQSKR